MLYYENKVELLRDLFGAAHVAVKPDGIWVDERWYPVVDDVILLLPPERQRAERVQRSFGAEWTEYREVLPEHRREFAEYVDLIDLAALETARVCDLGCGNGRWSVMLAEHCAELVLVDFSDAIFAARRNVRSNRAVFIMADLRHLPFRDDAFDVVFCAGVLHHVPVPALAETRRLRRLAPTLLMFLYYAFDNRPAHFRWMHAVAAVLRRTLCRVEHAGVRRVIARVALWALYLPLIALGHVLQPVGLARFVPLHEFYGGKSLRRIEQDVYDRFFTAIEQRVTRQEIDNLRDTFASVTISPAPPYWHFLCTR